MIRRNRKVIVNPFTVIVNLVACQPSIIHRRIGSIHRSGCRNRSVESSDNRQMKPRNRQVAPFLDQRSGPRNHQLIVNQFHVIINSTDLNPSTIHQQNARIHQPARRQPGVQSVESSDNHPNKSGNHPTDFTNLPINYRRILGRAMPKITHT